MAFPLNPDSLPVTTSVISWGDMVQRAWGSEYRAPDHNIYVWSNGRGMDSTDSYNTGIYRRPGT